VRLEQALGHLPKDWPTTPIRELRAASGRGSRWGRTLDASVFLRAVAIVVVVVHHVDHSTVQGGAHTLLGLAGYNFARFHLTAAERGERVRHLARSISRVAVASMVWIALAVTVTDSYALPNVFLVNYVFGSASRDDVWNFWFIEVLVYILLGLMALMAIPWVDRTERRLPFVFPLSLMALGLAVRWVWRDLDPGDASLRVTPLIVFWLFALGWLAARATTITQRLFVTATILLTIIGWFHDLGTEITIVVGLLLLVWISTIPSTRLLNRLAGVLAASSLYIYLTHWQVFPHLMGHSVVLALITSLVVGVVYAELFTRATAGIRRLIQARARSRPAGSHRSG